MEKRLWGAAKFGALALVLAFVAAGVSSVVGATPAAHGAAQISANGFVGLDAKKAKTYSIDFVEKGLPKKTSWCVTIVTQTCSTKSSLKFSGLAPGSYAYSVQKIAGWVLGTPSVTSPVTISTKNVKVSLTYTAYKYAVTFTETGLTGSFTWSVSIKGVPKTTSTKDEIIVDLANGTYSYKVGSEKGYTTAKPSPFTVNGGPATVSVTFTKKT